MKKLIFVLAVLLTAFGCSTPSSSGSSTPAFANAAFSNVTLQMITDGQSDRAFGFLKQAVAARAVGSAGATPSSYYGLFQFDLGTSSTEILGFDVYRSADGTNFTKIGTENYGVPTSVTTLQGPYTYVDFDPSLVLGTTYSYYVKAFDATGAYSAQSPTAAAPFMEPFTLSLTSPANGSQIGSSAPPLLSFTLSSPGISLWSNTLSDAFFFSLLVKNKLGNLVYYGEFLYSFNSDLGVSGFVAPGGFNSDGTADWTQKKTPVTSGMTYSGGTVTVDLSNSNIQKVGNPWVVNGSFSTLFRTGQTYEWDIFGSWKGANVGNVGSYTAMEPASFENFTHSTSGTGFGVSNANSYNNGSGSTNGAFSFSN